MFFAISATLKLYSQFALPDHIDVETTEYVDLGPHIRMMVSERASERVHLERTGSFVLVNPSHSCCPHSSSNAVLPSSFLPCFQVIANRIYAFNIFLNWFMAVPILCYLKVVNLVFLSLRRAFHKVKVGR